MMLWTMSSHRLLGSISTSPCTGRQQAAFSTEPFRVHSARDTFLHVHTVHVVFFCMATQCMQHFSVWPLGACDTFLYGHTVHVILLCMLTFFQVFMDTPHLQFEYLAILLGVQTVYDTLLRVLPSLMLPVRVRHGDVSPQRLPRLVRQLPVLVQLEPNSDIDRRTTLTIQDDHLT